MCKSKIIGPKQAIYKPFLTKTKSWTMNATAVWIIVLQRSPAMEHIPTHDQWRLLHGKCARTIFIHELRSIGKRTSERSERVSFLIRFNE